MQFFAEKRCDLNSINSRFSEFSLIQRFNRYGSWVNFQRNGKKFFAFLNIIPASLVLRFHNREDVLQKDHRLKYFFFVFIEYVKYSTCLLEHSVQP